uniref:Uncharacterized protein TCIL3000_11_9940 n=1 Tax=Trypanosoma congolense (strain IL3000) TaxID=1068625 RepID=G0V1K1_TRYCI|nr:unnamed protein product [Trypanosoma congolense IL3000]
MSFVTTASLKCTIHHQAMNTERNREEVRRTAQKDGNRFCMNCRMRGPIYVVLDFGIFVCSSCAAMHRAQQHKVKGITMTDFNDEEVARLRICGNDRAERVWLHRFNMERPKPGDEFALRRFFVRVFVDKEFANPDEYDKLQDDLLNLQLGETQKGAVEPPAAATLSAKAPSAVPLPTANTQTGASANANDDLFTDFLSAALPPAQAVAPTNPANNAPLTANDLFASVPQTTGQVDTFFPTTAVAQDPFASTGQFSSAMQQGSGVGTGGYYAPQPALSMPTYPATSSASGFNPTQAASGAPYAPYAADPMHTGIDATYFQGGTGSQFTAQAPNQPAQTTIRHDAFASLNPFGNKS